jgi:hypothetical protein
MNNAFAAVAGGQTGAYLQRWDREHLLGSEGALDRADLPPRDRLLALFGTRQRAPPPGAARSTTRPWKSPARTARLAP